MKKQTLLFLTSLFLGGFMYAQFSSGVVSLPTAAMTAKIDVNATNVTLTLTGDSNSMLGIGFGTIGMGSGSDGYIYNSSANRDYTFNGFVAPTADTAQDWTQISNTIVGSTRTIVAQRTLAGGTGDFAFTNAAGSINVFYAKRNNNQALGYHGSNRDYATLVLTPSLAVDDVAHLSKVAIYPNPVKDELNFTNSEKISSVKIYDANGKLLLSQKLEAQKLKVSELISGVYFIEIQKTDSTVSYEKVIKK